MPRSATAPSWSVLKGNRGSLGTLTLGDGNVDIDGWIKGVYPGQRGAAHLFSRTWTRAIDASTPSHSPQVPGQLAQDAGAANSVDFLRLRLTVHGSRRRRVQRESWPEQRRNDVLEVLPRSTVELLQLSSPLPATKKESFSRSAYILLRRHSRRSPTIGLSPKGRDSRRLFTT